MRAKVVCIESATTYVDDEERLTLRFEDADSGFSRIRLRRGVIDTTHALQLDDEIELTILAVAENSIKMAQMAAGKEKAKGARHES